MKLSDMIMGAVNGDNGDRMGLVLDAPAISAAARARREAVSDDEGLQATGDLFRAIKAANPDATTDQLNRAMRSVA